MATTGAQPIVPPTNDIAGQLIQSLLGSQQSGTTNAATQQLVNALTQGTQTGTQAGTQAGTTGSTTGSTTTNTANLAPLLQAFAASSQGMTPENMQALISSIFTEGARAVPELTQQFANSTGSRVQGNSGLNLALGDLNRQLSTQAAQAILQNNQQSQATAGQIAANIAANTRETQQQQQQAGTTQQASTANTTQANTENRAQTQTGTTNTTQQQQTGANPMRAALLGLGGVGLNFLDKKGLFDGLFGRTATPAAGAGVGTISGSGSLAPTASAGSTLANPGGFGNNGFLSAAPAASQGAYSVPVAAQPQLAATPLAAAPAAGNFSIGTPSVAPGLADFTGGSFAPAAGGITGLGGFGDTAGGFLGTAANQGFGALPDAANYFGTASTGSLGENLNFGANPYGYGGSAGGITGAVGGAQDQGLFGGLQNFGSSIWGGAQDLFGGIGDWASSFFADGGQVSSKDNARELRTMMNQRDANLATRPAYGFSGMNFGQITEQAARDQALRNGISSTLDPSMIGQLLQMIVGAPNLPGGGAVAPAAPANVSPKDNARELRGMMDQRHQNLAAAPAYGFSGMNMGQIMDQTARDQGLTRGINATLDPNVLQQMMQLFTGPPALPGTGYADGGQVDTGAAPTRTRNTNYMGPRQRDAQSEALNYSGYAPAGVGASVPAGGSPSLGIGSSGLGALAAPSGMMSMMAPGTPTAGVAPTAAAQYIDPAQRAREMFMEQMFAQQARDQAAQLAVERAGGSGGIGEGAAPSQDEASNGAMGIAPSGIAAAPPGTSAAIGLAAPAALGMATPGLGTAFSIMSFLAQQVNAANQAQAQAVADAGFGGGQPGAVSSPVGQSTVTGLDLGMLGSDPGMGPEGSAPAGAGGAVGGIGGEGAGSSATSSTGVGDAPGTNGDGSPAGGWKDGGLVKGVGTGTSDSIRVKSREPGGKDIYYSDEEYVIPKDVVRALGVQHFDSLLEAFHTPASLQ